MCGKYADTKSTKVLRHAPEINYEKHFPAVPGIFPIALRAFYRRVFSPWGVRSPLVLPHQESLYLSMCEGARGAVILKHVERSSCRWKPHTIIIIGKVEDKSFQCAFRIASVFRLHCRDTRLGFLNSAITCRGGFRERVTLYVVPFSPGADFGVR